MSSLAQWWISTTQTWLPKNTWNWTGPSSLQSRGAQYSCLMRFYFCYLYYGRYSTFPFLWSTKNIMTILYGPECKGPACSAAVRDSSGWVLDTGGSRVHQQNPGPQTLRSPCTSLLFSLKYTWHFYLKIYICSKVMLSVCCLPYVPIIYIYIYSGTNKGIYNLIYIYTYIYINI